MPTRKQDAYSKDSRCWPGYEPVPGRRPNQEGSCRKKPASRSGGGEVDREQARRQAQRSAKTPKEKAQLQMKSSSPRVRAQGKRALERLRRESR
jgi:hypothetical protein